MRRANRTLCPPKLLYVHGDCMRGSNKRFVYAHEGTAISEKSPATV